MLYFMQTANDVRDILSIESVSVMVLLLAICFYLVWDKNKLQKTYKELLGIYNKEQADNKKILIELVSKSILATEQNTNAINSIKDVLNNK